MSFIFAHYGGIDEVGIFVIPVLLAIWGLRLAEKNARKKAAERAGNVAEEGNDDE
jgi:mannose/fructose/N-acetylgalactosamine-specific phosphotransferase system component IIC